MYKTTNISLIILLSFFLNQTYSQCNIETITYDNGSYNGCVNYEGEKHGEGTLSLNLETQSQIQKGTFKNDNFLKGILIVDFYSGDKRTVTYEDYQSDLIKNELYEWENGNKRVTEYKNGFKLKDITTYISGDKKTVTYEDYQSDLIKNELYEWENGDKVQTIYESGLKVKEISTYGPGESQGLIIEKYFDGNETFTVRNTDNNRYPDDIVGNNEYSDVRLIERDNQFRINIGFPTNEGDVMNVPIQFDSGATSFFIGNRLYKDLLEKCEIEDMNVEGVSGGVGSEFKTKYIKIKELIIGDYTVKNVIAVVPLREDINDLLVGVGFLKKFKEVLWSLNSNLMRFYK